MLHLEIAIPFVFLFGIVSPAPRLTLEQNRPITDFNDPGLREAAAFAVGRLESMSDRPVTVTFSNHLGGTWKIETGLRYKFRVEVEVRDKSSGEFIGTTKCFLDVWKHSVKGTIFPKHACTDNDKLKGWFPLQHGI